MKRTKNVSTDGGEQKKRRVRFDPEIKDNEPEPTGIVKPPAATKTTKKPRSFDNDGLDILGRKLDDSTAGTSIDDEALDSTNKKHTLDSDEEEEKVEPKHLNIKSIQGQEDATIEYDGSIKIMPFNMKDDEEEGHFDETGNFIYNKEKDEVRDEWMDNIDWDSVKHKAGNQWGKADDDEDGRQSPEANGVAACEKIIKFLDDKSLVSKENSTVNDVLKKLNSQKNLSAAEERKRRWDAKKKGVEYKNEFSELANELTGAVDDLIKMGHMNAYSMTRGEIDKLYEELELAKERAERASRNKKLEEKQRQESEAAKPETTQNLIDDLMSDEENEDQEQADVEMSEVNS